MKIENWVKSLCALAISFVIVSCATYGDYGDKIAYLIDGNKTSLNDLIDNPESYNRKPIEGEFYFSCKGDYYAFFEKKGYETSQEGREELGYRFRFLTPNNDEFCAGEQPKYFIGTLITTCAYTSNPTCPHNYHMYLVID